jgi:ferritin-like metal-binding protein YciE
VQTHVEASIETPKAWTFAAQYLMLNPKKWHFACESFLFFTAIREYVKPSPQIKMSKTITNSVKETLGFEKVSSLEELFIEQLQDLHSAETQLIKALPLMADAATSRELKKGFKHHLEQTKVHAERLEQILSRHDAKAEGKTCQAMKGLIKEGNETITEYTTKEIKDAALIADAQRVEHYEIAGYGTVVAFAKLLGDSEAEENLTTTLNEESATDETLTELSESLNLRPSKTRGVTPAKSSNRLN